MIGDCILVMAPDPRQLRAQRFPLHAAVESGDLERTRALLEGSLRSVSLCVSAEKDNS